MKLVPVLRGGLVVAHATVDSDFDAESHRLYLTRGGYAQTKIAGKMIQMHRLVLGLTDPSVLSDHINRSRLDNRRCNLRAADTRGNAQNRQPQSGSRSGVRGAKGRARLMPFSQDAMVARAAGETFA